ncbi:Guanine-specific ribonuclease N1/T1 [Penicillium soppii]|uniref:Guanine-specific ribonuclease N1/T1 n=1 Tax=Penicillium soppii TaxID=69789 RepID=UPI002548397F|nr:Guanine-specific ribonuclease N1/T1 [Penicillium soppii]KAJ5873050.1 Guanine-specific ribonuclease N1/T1 [Penicillium soppii]
MSLSIASRAKSQVLAQESHDLIAIILKTETKNEAMKAQPAVRKAKQAAARQPHWYDYNTMFTGEENRVSHSTV